MGLRSNFPRIPQDAYDTPPEGALPLLPFLPPRTRFCEPCAGSGQLRAHLEAHGHHGMVATDIEPRCPFVARMSVADLVETDLWYDCAMFITNPPYERKVLHPIIDALATRRPTWLLLDAGWLFAAKSTPFLPWVKAVVRVPRLKWIPGSRHAATTDHAWLLFDAISPAAAVPIRGK